jgi:Autoinducer binding domain
MEVERIFDLGIQYHNATDLCAIRTVSDYLITNGPVMIHDYQACLYEHLNGIKDYSKFSNAISEELMGLGLNAWAMAPLDIPLELAGEIYLGTIKKEHKSLYMMEAFYEIDILMQHANNNGSPILQSHIGRMLDTPVSTVHIERNRALLKMNRSLGYNNFYSVTCGDKRKNSRSVFSITSEGMRADEFETIVNRHQQQLESIAATANEIGILNFPEIFKKQKNEVNKLIYSQPFNYLITMIKYDLTATQVAHRTNTSYVTIKKALASVRNQFGVHTNQAAFLEAIKQGLIDHKFNYLPS